MLSTKCYRTPALPFVFSVCFNSLAPARLALRANLWLLYLKGPAFSIVVNLLPTAPTGIHLTVPICRFAS